MLDRTDMEILKCLRNNGRLLWKEIGDTVHMTGQAVSARVEKLKEMGIIKCFTVDIDNIKLGKAITAFITVFMKSNDHKAFQNYLITAEGVEEAHRISGDGCYWVKACISTQEELNSLLDGILIYGNYRLSISIGEIDKEAEMKP